MTYAETLAYLYAQLPMFQRVGKAAYKADMGNTHALMDLLDHPERGLRCVHVAGTNGKGSTSHMIASILQEAGYNVGLHTSPHLKDFRERFRINGEMIPEATVSEFVKCYRTGFEPIQASFFEWGVALALWWFREEQVDIAVVETGMGGRLDSTNVVTPEVSVITNIGWDHMEFLGNTRAAIAGEKAGIIKAGVPVVIGAAQQEELEVFLEKARSLKAPLSAVDQDREIPYPIALRGKHQERNARTALEAIRLLRKKSWHVEAQHEREGLSKVVENTGLWGRWQVLATEPLIVADVAHNVDGVTVLLEEVARTPHTALHIVVGMVNDKDLGHVLSILPRNATYYFCKADIPRGLAADQLAQEAAEFGLNGLVHPSVQAAYQAAKQAAGPTDLILVTGSVFVVGEVV